MTGSKVSNFALGDSNIQSVMLTLDKTFKGQHQVSLTNYSTTAESQVAAGSVIEIGGALYKFDSNESITGTPSDGTVYIMAVPAGDSVTCAYTNTAPTWSDSKQGWYGTGATVNNRYMEFQLDKAGSDYIKYILTSNLSRRLRIKNLFVDKISVGENNSYYLTDDRDGLLVLSKTAGETGTFDFIIKKACSLSFSAVSGSGTGGTISGSLTPFHFRLGVKTLYDDSNLKLSFTHDKITKRYSLHVQPCYFRVVLSSMGVACAFQMSVHSWSDANSYGIITDLVDSI